MKKVLEIVPNFGFAESFLSGRLKDFASKGLEMHLACSWDDKLPDFAAAENIHCLSTKISRIPALKDDFIAIRKISMYIKKEGIDCIVGHADKGKLLAVICGILTRRKVILYAHGTSFEGRGRFGRFVFITLDRLESYFAKCVICVSPFLKELRLKEKIDRQGKAFVPNMGSCGGIDCYGKFNPDNITENDKKEIRQSLGLRDTDFVIGFCGRIVRDKGVEELVHAFEIFKKSVANAKLLMLGAKDIRDGVAVDVQNTMDSDLDILQCGSVKDRIQRYYSLMDMFILPTHRDGLGMCLLEAGSMGVPVFTTSHTGSRDTILPGVTGEYIALQPENIAKAMLSMYNNSAQRKAYGESGRKWVCDNFNTADVRQAIFECYMNVLNS